MKSLIGTGVALVTPFKNDGTVDVESLKKIVRYNIDNGVEYLVVLGTTAETPTLSKAEKELVIQTIIEENAKKLPLVFGVGGNNTQEIVNELNTRDLSMFSAILSVSPYYNKPTQEGIYQHFKKISENSSIPILLYNVPSRTASNILPETVLRLANDCQNIIGIKEASGDLVQAMKIIQNKPKDFLVISGDDMIALPMILAGGDGVISVIGEGFPREFSEMVRLGSQGKIKEAYQIHYKLADAIDLIFEQGNPTGIKEVFKHLGLSTNTIRLPLVNVNKDLSERIKTFISNF